MPRPRKRPRASSHGSSDASDRIFATRREGIFKKASVLAQLVPGTRVAIFVERNQEIFTFRSDENLTSWPPSMEEIQRAGNPINKFPCHYQSAAEARLQGDKTPPSSRSSPELLLFPSQVYHNLNVRVKSEPAYSSPIGSIDQLEQFSPPSIHHDGMESMDRHSEALPPVSNWVSRSPNHNDIGNHNSPAPLSEIFHTPYEDPHQRPHYSRSPSRNSTNRAILPPLAAPVFGTLPSKRLLE